MCFTPMNHGHSPALQPETNSFHLGTNTEIGKPQLSRKWVPKTPGKILPSENSMAWRMKRYVYTAQYQSDAWNKTNQTLDQQDSGFHFSRISEPDVWPSLQEIDVICPQMGNAFSTCLLKKNLNPKYLNLNLSKTTSFSLRFLRFLWVSPRKNTQDTHRVLLRHWWIL